MKSRLLQSFTILLLMPCMASAAPSAPQRMSDELLLFKSDSLQGDYVAAIRHYARYIEISDTAFTTARDKEIARLEAQYESEKKDHNILLLNKQSGIQQAQLQKEQLTRNITIGGAIMLLLLLGMGYNRYRVKQQVSRQLEKRQAEINDKNQSLRKLIAEKDELLQQKEWLLKEVHHRVKNNLQIVMSLLSSQSVYLENNEAVNAIRDSSQRMHSMSLIHQKLYQSENVSDINMATYIHELVAHLQDCFDVAHRIQFELDVDDVLVDVGQAVPLGLILNESVTNAIKYAFPGNREGIITIKMYYISYKQLQLVIADNGIGLPDGFNTTKSNSLGMGLMLGLAKQLNGMMKFINKNGLQLMMDFPDEKMERPVSLTNTIKTKHAA